MSSHDAIGGYFSLELKKSELFYPDLLALNSGRNAFEYIILARKYTKVYIPFFTCDVMLEPLIRHNINYEFYSINNYLELKVIPDLQKSEALLYTNYFGLKSLYAETLKLKIKNLILDNAQAFYSKPSPNIDTFYSPRKFFGLPDGAYLSSEVQLNETLAKDENSVERCTHLLLRLDAGAENGYSAFKRNDFSLTNQPIKRMSDLTMRLLSGIDYNWVLKKRNENFLFLHEHLKEVNEFKWIDNSVINGPMIYPFYTSNVKLKQELINNKIFVATYWPNVFDWADEDSVELKLTKNLIPLPIDQRYGVEDMRLIFEKIKELL